MPFSAQPAHVPRVVQHLTKGGELGERVVRLRPHHIFRIEKRVHAVLRWNEPRKEGRPRGRAHRIAAQGVCKANPLGGEAIDVWRANVWITITSERPRALIIREDEYDVR